MLLPGVHYSATGERAVDWIVSSDYVGGLEQV